MRSSTFSSLVKLESKDVYKEQSKRPKRKRKNSTQIYLSNEMGCALESITKSMDESVHDTPLEKNDNASVQKNYARLGLRRSGIPLGQPQAARILLVMQSAMQVIAKYNETMQPSLDPATPALPLWGVRLKCS